FRETQPPGYIEHRMAFGVKGKYGKWLRNRTPVIRINGMVFSHADMSEEFSSLGIAKINTLAKNELAGQKETSKGILFNPKGPFWCRGLAKVPLTRAEQKAMTATVDRILSNLDAKRMVVGHTVTANGVIEPRFGGKHLSIDTGMLHVYCGGHQVALEVVGDRYQAIHPDGKIELPAYLDESNLRAYLEAVAKIDPDNPTVREKLSELAQAGQIKEKPAGEHSRPAVSP
ncbi:hypothetical protein ACFLU6_02885, partial [Acidobacteriota bacterium]